MICFHRIEAGCKVKGSIELYGSSKGFDTTAVISNIEIISSTAIYDVISTCTAQPVQLMLSTRCTQDVDSSDVDTQDVDEGDVDSDGDNSDEADVDEDLDLGEE